MPMIRVRDIDMHYEVHGPSDAEPLVLIHGFTETGRAFAPFIDPLGERYQLIVPDWRGHGRTTNPQNKIAHAGLGRDMGAFVTSLGIPRAHFCGTSSGGMQLLFLALEQPPLVHSLTLVAATYRIDDHARTQASEVIASISPERVEKLEARHGPTHGSGYSRTLLNRWQDAVFRPNELSFTPDDLGRIACPTLIIHGDRDRFFPVRVPVAMYEAIPNAELCVVPNCGHVVTRQNPTLFTTALLDFLGRNPFPDSSATGS
jgi:pimeloyl-ACP methyl ester carboxylesterase